MRPFQRREASSRTSTSTLPLAAVLGFVAVAGLAVAIGSAAPGAPSDAAAIARSASTPAVAAGVNPVSSPTALSTAPAAASPAASPSSSVASPSAAHASISRVPAVQPRALTAPSAARPAPLPTRETAEVAFTRPVPCGNGTCRVRLDVYSPSTPGHYPAVVLVRGGPSGMTGRTGLGPFAAQLAARGHVVFNADMRDIAASGGGYPAAFEDVACAVRFARAEAARFGGESSRVTLVGHSLGGWVGSVVAFGEERDASSCLYGGSGRPDAFVGLAGNYDLSAPGEVGDLLKFFGGDARATGAARAASDPLAVTPARMPVRLIAGTADGTVDPAASIALEKRLEQFGLDAALTRVPGGTHISIVSLAADGRMSLAVIDQVADDLPGVAEDAGGPPFALRLRPE